jgi:hypothetical protein
VYFMNWFHMVYFHVIIEVSPPVQTRIKRSLPKFGYVFQQCLYIVVLGPKFLNVVFYSLFCSSFTLLPFWFFVF